MATPSIVVIGKSGQLATALQREGGDSVLALGRNELDVASVGSVRDALRRYRPRLVLNASAYTAVDKAESEREAALTLNATVPGILAECSAESGAAFLHVSTDYVFDGEKGAPYVEGDPTCPVNYYGETKLRGEAAALSVDSNVAVVRTSWVFSAAGSNFVRTMLRLATDREEIGVVADQYGRPTAAADLARACLAVGAGLAANDDSAKGVFHFANSGETTWAEFAAAVMNEAASRGLKAARIRPITSADYPTPAARPRDSRLATSRIESLMSATPRHWTVALSEVVRSIA